jgi:DNA-binding transcriptional MerR regulator
MIEQGDPNNAIIDDLVATAKSSLAEIEGNLIYTVDDVTFRTRIIPVCRDRYMTMKQCLEIMKAYPVPDRVDFSFI